MHDSTSYQNMTAGHHKVIDMYQHIDVKWQQMHLLTAWSWDPVGSLITVTVLVTRIPFAALLKTSETYVTRW